MRTTPPPARLGARTSGATALALGRHDEQPASPPWVAPDPALRAQVVERLEASYVRDAIGAETGQLLPPRYSIQTRFGGQVVPGGGDVSRRAAYGHPRSGALLGPRPHRVSWCACVLHARSANGLAKALVRRPLARRFPELGFDRQRKSKLGVAFLSVLETQAGAARQAMGGFPTLVDLGVIDREQVRVLLDDALAGRSHRERLGWAWELLNLEAWARAHR